MGPRASTGGLLSHSQVSSLRLQLEELDGWCRISLARFCLPSKVVVLDVSWVLTAGAVGALGIWGGDVLAPTSGTCCSRVSGQPGRAAPADLCRSSRHRAPVQFPRAVFHHRLSLCSLTASSLPAGMNAQACPQH